MIGERIRQARTAAGLTQDEVVGQLEDYGVELTKGGLSKYERGGSTPPASTLRGLGRVLDVKPSFFFEQPSASVQWLAFRKASALGKKRQERIKILAEQRVDSIVQLLDVLEPKAKPRVPKTTAITGPEDVEAAATRLRDAWKLGEQPIESVTAAIELNGGIVVEPAEEDDGFDGLSGWVNDRIPVTVVSPSVSDDRRRFSLAHELGHLFMDCQGVDEKTEERYAHRFAAAFLVPASVAKRELGERRRHLNFRELGLLKRRHGLSMQAWIFRAADLGIIDDAHKRTLYVEMGRRGWRRREPVDFDGQEQPKRLCQLTARAYAEGVITQERAETLCPGITKDMGEEETKMPESLDARTLLKLPKADRDRIMAKAAALIEDEYREGGGLSGFESLSEEDHRDDAVSD